MPWNGSSHSWAVYLVVEARNRDREAVAEDEEEEDAGGEVEDWGVVDEDESVVETDEACGPLGRGRRFRSV